MDRSGAEQVPLVHHGVRVLRVVHVGVCHKPRFTWCLARDLLQKEEKLIEGWEEATETHVSNDHIAGTLQLTAQIKWG